MTRILTNFCIALLGVAAVATALSLSGTANAAPASPGWFLQVQSQSADLSEQGAGEDGPLAACAKDIVKYCIGPRGERGATCLKQHADGLSAVCKDTLAAIKPRQGGGGVVPRCSHSPLCSNTLGG